MDSGDLHTPLAADLHIADHRVGTTTGACLNFFKQMFGAGILALPRAFRWSGLYGGIGSFALVLVVSSYSMHLLIMCFHTVRKKQPVGPLSYAALGRAVFGPLGGNLLGVLIIILEGCFCTGWIIVAAEQILAVCGHELLSRSAWIFLILQPTIAVLCCFPHLSRLWPLSFLGLLVYCVVGAVGAEPMPRHPHAAPSSCRAIPTLSRAITMPQTRITECRQALACSSLNSVVGIEPMAGQPTLLHRVTQNISMPHMKGVEPATTTPPTSASFCPSLH